MHTAVKITINLRGETAQAYVEHLAQRLADRLSDVSGYGLTVSVASASKVVVSGGMGGHVFDDGHSIDLCTRLLRDAAYSSVRELSPEEYRSTTVVYSGVTVESAADEM